ncbi:MAG: low molecular weight protein-tyrosine-phosphatase [Dokdonella sp.]
MYFMINIFLNIMIDKENQRILFICMGNICRSPIVEAVARVEFARAGVAVHAESAGTEDYHVGQPADRRAIRIAEANAYPLAAHRARQVCNEDFETFDHLLVMDHVNLRALERWRSAWTLVAPRLFLAEAGLGDVHVPDPYYGTDVDFERVVALARSGVNALIKRLSSDTRRAGDGHAQAGT